MLRYAILVLTGAALIGCQSGNNNPPNSGANPNPNENTAPTTNPSAMAPNEMNAERAAYAARAQYPVEQATNDLHLTALENRANPNEIQVINPTDRNIDNAAVWINGKYVTFVAHVPAHSVVKVSRDQFYDNAGHRLSDGNTPADHIQVELDNRLFNVMGPAIE
jgi:hypothetical protein